MVPSFKRQILEIPARNKTKQFNIIWQVNVQKERSIFEGSAISLVRLVSPNLTIPPSQTRLLPLFPFCSAGLDYRLDYQLRFKKRVLAPTPNSHRLDSSEWRKSRYCGKKRKIVRITPLVLISLTLKPVGEARRLTITSELFPLVNFIP